MVLKREKRIEEIEEEMIKDGKVPKNDDDENTG